MVTDRVFGKLKIVRAFRKRHLAFLETMVDYDLLLEIGYHQEEGRPLTIKQLHLLGICSVPTLQRRLRHLREAGAVLHERMSEDARAVQVTLPARLLKIYDRYRETIRATFMDA
ncbi:MAG: hypothetical protein JOZ85_07115 [Betaproteobacteria bacterium]|nr:hypothetical protein [Betaproteobacteria bacterium]